MKVELTQQSFNGAQTSQRVQQNIKSPSKFISSNAFYQSSGFSLFSILALYFLVFGIVQFVINYGINSHNIQMSWDENNNIYRAQTSKLSLLENQTINVYLELKGFAEIDVYQDLHRDNSIFEDIGDIQNHYSNCGKFTTNQEIQKNYSSDGDILVIKEKAVPCGYRQSNFPKGKLSFIQKQSQVDVSAQISQIQKKSIFKNINISKQWLDVQNSALFTLWMEKSCSITSKKLWARIEGPLIGTFIIQYQTEKISDINNISVSLQYKGVSTHQYNIYINYFVYCLVMIIFWLIERRVKARKFLNINNSSDVSNSQQEGSQRKQLHFIRAIKISRYKDNDQEVDQTQFYDSDSESSEDFEQIFQSSEFSN